MKYSVLFSVLCMGAASAHANTSAVWAEGSCGTDGQNGATIDYYNRGAGLFWQNTMGDWVDSQNTKQGNAPFATLSIPDIDKEQAVSTNISDVVEGWLNGSIDNQGLFIRRLDGGSTKLFSREYDNGSKASFITIFTTDGEFTVKTTADTYLSASTYKCLGKEERIDTGNNVLMYFDLSEANITGDFLNAELTLLTRNRQYGSDSTLGVFLAKPEFAKYELPQSGMGLAAEYPNDYAIRNDPRVLMAEDFESPHWENQWSIGSSKDDLSIVDSHPEEKFVPMLGMAARARLTTDSLTAMNVSYLFQKELGYEPEEVYFRYYIRFGDNWKTVDGGKLPGIAGTYEGTSYGAGWGGGKSNGTNGWSARGIFRKVIEGDNPSTQEVPIGNYLYHADMQDPYGDVLVWDGEGRGTLEKNRWYAVEQYVKLNTPGQNDGVLRTWVDGKPAYEVTGLSFRDEGYDHIKIDRIWMNIYHGGTTKNDREVNAYVDNVVIATDYIGPALVDPNSPVAAYEPNKPPVIDVVSGHPEDFTQAIGETIHLQTDIADPEGGNVDIKWYFNGEVVAKNTNEFGFIPSLNEVGLNEVTVTATDEDGDMTEVHWNINVEIKNIIYIDVNEDTHLSTSTYKSLGYEKQLYGTDIMYFRTLQTSALTTDDVTKAFLVLENLKQYGDSTVEVYAADNEWAEGDGAGDGATREYSNKATETKWNHYMGDWTDNTNVKNGNVPFSTTVLRDTDVQKSDLIDITRLAKQQWQNGVINIALKVVDGVHRFASTEHIDTNIRPKLLITLNGMELREEMTITTDTFMQPPVIETVPSVPAVPEMVLPKSNDLVSLAASLQPGEWGEVETNGLTAELLTVHYDNAGYHIAGWTDDAMWDSNTQQLMYMGFRKETKMVTYSLETNSWSEVQEKFVWPKENRTGHIYGNNAMNPANGDFYHMATGTDALYRRAATGGEWEKLAVLPFHRDGIATAIEYFPEMGGILRIQRNRMHFYDVADNSWHDLGALPELGYHSLMRYNPITKEVLVAGGNENRTKVVAIDAQGNIRELANAPVDLGIRDDKLLVNPTNGNYMFFTQGQLYDFDSQTGTYTLTEGFVNPHGDGEMPFTATIAEHGVIVFVDKTVRIYKPASGERQ